MNIPRNEYPRPQMVRSSWTNLNGEWQFAFDFGKTGKERGLQNADTLDRTVLVPFCPESKLSGIEYKDFMNAVWYRREFCAEKKPGQRTLLHFEAVDYFSTVWVNGTEVGRHMGGYTPFTFDITDVLRDGSNTVTLYAEDDCRDPLIPRGKQSEKFYSSGCDYTRTTGIWQTVWMENVPETYLKNYRCTADIDNGTVTFALEIHGLGMKNVHTAVSYGGKTVAEACHKVSGTRLSFTMPLSEVHLWDVGQPELYDVVFTVDGGGEKDVVRGYFGMRSVELSDNAILLNGRPVFQRLVLDQGFYRDGIYTAPSDADLKKDIELSMAAGFNGARLHQKVFERRFLYWADRMGYLVWGEYGNWGLDVSDPAALGSMLTPWLESVDRDFNSPALVGWCPFNETWDYQGRPQNNLVLLSVYKATKAADPTRPVIDTSGNYHVQTDIFDVHDYEQDVEKFAEHYAPMITGGPVYNWCGRQSYGGEPYFVSEYGGILWNENMEEGWGYGKAPKTREEYAERYAGLARVLLDNPRICALCYTQLYDVEQEKNGIYTYDRELKFPAELMEKMRQAMTQPAAIER